MLSYKTIKGIAKVLLRALYKVEIIHTAPIPSEGAMIICANHIHTFDPVIMAIGIKREIRFMAKAEIFEWPVIGYIAKQCGAFPVKRGSADIQAIKKALQILKNQDVLGIFPEGTRSKTGERNELYQGVTMLAEKSEAVILPAAITGSYKFRQPLRIIFGEPLSLEALCPNQDYDRAVATANLMQHIQRLKELA